MRSTLVSNSLLSSMHLSEVKAQREFLTLSSYTAVPYLSQGPTYDMPCTLFVEYVSYALLIHPMVFIFQALGRPRLLSRELTDPALRHPSA